MLVGAVEARDEPTVSRDEQEEGRVGDDFGKSLGLLEQSEEDMVGWGLEVADRAQSSAHR